MILLAETIKKRCNCGDKGSKEVMIIKSESQAIGYSFCYSCYEILKEKLRERK